MQLLATIALGVPAAIAIVVLSTIAATIPFTQIITLVLRAVVTLGFALGPARLDALITPHDMHSP